MKLIKFLDYPMLNEDLLVGRNSKLGLSGRPSDVVGILATSKLYTLGDKTMAFLPQVSEIVFYVIIFCTNPEICISYVCSLNM